MLTIGLSLNKDGQSHDKGTANIICIDTLLFLVLESLESEG